MIPKIFTHSGHLFSLLDPELSVINVDDIAHALSHLCRFTGHTRCFYSVAQHSVFVSHLVPPEHALAGLLHDAAEAYLGDVSAPLKSLLPDYRALETRVHIQVMKHFGLPSRLPNCVHEADGVMLVTEARDLLPEHEGHYWPDHHKPLQHILKVNDCWTPGFAWTQFISRYKELQRATSAGFSASRWNLPLVTE